MLPWLSPLWLVLQKKIMQRGIFVFVKVQEINFLGNLLCSKSDWYYHHNLIINYSITRSFTEKACKYAIKRDSKIFSWNSQKNRTPSAKHLGQTPFFRFGLRASPVIESFILKLKTITTCFEQIFSP